MSELNLKHCPYCEKNVPYRKASRGGALAFGIIASIMAPIYLFVFFLFIQRILGLIIFIVAISIFVIFEVFYWRWYKRRLRYFCNICKSTVQPRSEISVTPVRPTEEKVGYCANCGAVKGKESAGFCAFCGTKF